VLVCDSCATPVCEISLRCSCVSSRMHWGCGVAHARSRVCVLCVRVRVCVCVCVCGYGFMSLGCMTANLAAFGLAGLYVLSRLDVYLALNRVAFWYTS
jgi:hypothetical protein